MALTEAEIIDKTVELLDQSHEYDVEQLKNLVLFVGISGSGKSTLCQFLAENPHLVSKQDGSTSDFYISDGEVHISGSTIDSKTVFPEILSIPNSNVTIADCPGFGITRSPQHDMAANAFIQQLLGKAENVKIVLVTSYHAVKEDIGRVAFADMLRYASTFIKDIEKFRSSIALLVTKVENVSYEDDDGNYVLADDELVIDQINNFLTTKQVELKKIISDNKDIARQSQLLDILCEEKKIGIFRRPTRDEVLNQNERLLEQRDVFKQMMDQQLTYTRIGPEDFGPALSDNSKILVHKLRLACKKKQAQILNDYLASLESMLELETNKLDRFEDIELSINRLDTMFKQIAICKQRNGSSLSISGFMHQTRRFGTQESYQLYSEWLAQSKLEQFLESVVGKRYVSFNHQLGSFQNILTENKHIIGIDRELFLREEIWSTFTNIMADIENLENLEEKIPSINELFEVFLHKTAEKVPFQVFLSRFSEILDKVEGFKVNSIYIQQLQSFQAEITFMKNKINPSFLDEHRDEWFEAIRISLVNLNSKVVFKNFISYLEPELSKYKIQSVIESFGGNIKNWNEFRVFAPKLRQAGSLMKQLQATTVLSAEQLKDFYALLDFATNKPTYVCETFKLLVTGSFIKISQVIAEIIPNCAAFKEIYLFAAQTVFIDATLNAASKNVYLIAPTWHVVGEHKVNLKGEDAGQATSVESIKPGGPGGSFLGFGEKFIDDYKLTVDVSGGQGAHGVDGKDGVNGINREYDKESECGQHIKKLYGEPAFDKNKKFFDYEHYAEIQLSANKGTPGSHATDGSQSGFGGKSGKVITENIDKTHLQLRRLQNEGPRGSVGKGGKGGIGGNHGLRMDLQCYRYPEGSVYAYEIPRYQHLERKAPDGECGKDGIVGSPQKPADPQPQRSLAIVAAEYKQYFEGKSLQFGNTRNFIANNFVDQVNSRRRRSVQQYLPPVIPNRIPAANRLLTIQHSNEIVTTSYANTTLSSMMQLADLVIRKFKKITPRITQYPSDKDMAVDRLLVQAKVLEMVEKSEHDYNERHGHDSRAGNFDPIPLLKKFKKMYG